MESLEIVTALALTDIVHLVAAAPGVMAGACKGERCRNQRDWHPRETTLLARH